MKHIKGMESGALIIKAPKPLETNNKKSVFLAGTIDNGKSEDWQSALTQAVSNLNIAILNPRRTSWNEEANQKEIEAQIEWEMDALDIADLIVFYFAPNSKSPVTMLELGRYASRNKCIVCCPEGFWRKTNVDVFCRRTGVKTVESIEDLANEIMKLEKGD